MKWEGISQRPRYRAAYPSRTGASVLRLRGVRCEKMGAGLDLTPFNSLHSCNFSLRYFQILYEIVDAFDLLEWSDIGVACQKSNIVVAHSQSAFESI